MHMSPVVHHHRRPVRAIAMLCVAVGLALALSACGSSSGSSGGGSAAVTIKTASPVATFTVKPVKAGAKVTVKNDDSLQHTVTSDDGHSFNVTVDAGKTATFTAPSTPGTYPFHCNIHATMKSKLVVE